MKHLIKIIAVFYLSTFLSSIPVYAQTPQAPEAGIAFPNFKLEQYKPIEKLPESDLQPVSEVFIAPVVSQTVIPGNGYDYGNCTWYVKFRKPSLPNNLGNANAWMGSAQSQGLTTGEIPQIGAVAWTPRGYWGHVAYVENVNGDQIYIAEMNVLGLGQTDEKWVPAADYRYIY